LPTILRRPPSALPKTVARPRVTPVSYPRTELTPPAKNALKNGSGFPE
jgi:hypothetical protein